MTSAATSITYRRAGHNAPPPASPTTAGPHSPPTPAATATATAHTHTLDHLVADLVHITRTLDETPVLIGASLGGITALLAQVDHAIARALVLVDIAPQINIAGVDRILDFMTRHRDGFATLNDGATAITAYNSHRPRSATVDGLPKNLRQHHDGRWYWHWDSNSSTTWPAPQLSPTSPTAWTITTPTLLIRGELSDLIDQHSIAHLCTASPLSTPPPRTGHMIVGDDNDTFTTHLLDFLNTVQRIPTNELPLAPFDGRLGLGVSDRRW